MKMVQKPRKSLVAFALASAIGGAMVSAPAQAVHLSPDGLGSAMVFPYYTAKNGFDTYVHLTNTSDETVVAKIRFREAKNSREVRDFNIVLSPYDVWTAAVTQDGDGAKLVTYDKSCTSPILPPSETSPGATEIDFTSLGYDGSNAYHYDNGGLGIERVQEGYFEVIAMGMSDVGLTGHNVSSNVVEYNAKHVNGVPRDCAIVDNAFLDLGVDGPFDDFVPTENVLKGFSTLINVASGQAVGVEPVMFANFNLEETIIHAPGDLNPDLNDLDETEGAAFVDSDGELLRVYAARSWDAAATPPGAVKTGMNVDLISALLMRRNVINEFTSTAAGTTQTDWVLTFPTKHNYTDDGGVNNTVGTPLAPFDEWFAKEPTTLTNHAGKSCVTISPTYYDREERTARGSGTDFSPRPQGGKTELCNEVNVLSFNGSDVFGSASRFNIDTTAVGRTGWMNLLVGEITALGTEGKLPLSTFDADEDEYTEYTMFGMPVTGFGAVVRYNDAEAGNNRNYGVTEEHSYIRATGEVGDVVEP